MNTMKLQFEMLSVLILFTLSGLAFDYVFTVPVDTIGTVVPAASEQVVEKQQEPAEKQINTTDKPAVEHKVVQVSPQPKLVGDKSTVKEDIVKHSIEMDVDPALALAIAKTESNFDHSRTSHRGAVGVFQLLPSTARSMGYNPYTQNENIKGGLTYFKKMYQRFGDVDLALAAYNAGPGNVARYKGVPPFAETQRYINKIKIEYENQKNNPLIEKYQNSRM